MKEIYRCISCNVRISKGRHYCYGCFTEAERKAGETNE
mgnify:FL=1